MSMYHGMHAAYHEAVVAHVVDLHDSKRDEDAGRAQVLLDNLRIDKGLEVVRCRNECSSMYSKYGTSR